MGEAIKSRGSGAEPYRVGDIVLTANETLGEKWALCNGDPVTGEGISPELAESLSANPLDDNAWQEIPLSNNYNKILYDNVNDIYYGIKYTNYTPFSTVYIYKINLSDNNEELLGQHTYRYNYGGNDYYTQFIDICYSTYKGKILILMSYFFEIVDAIHHEQYRYCLHEFDTNTCQFTDINNFVHPNQFDNNYANSIIFRGCGVETGDYYDEYTYTDYYIPREMYIAENWLFFLCQDPKASIFKLNLQNTSYNNSTVTDIDYDIYGNEVGDDSGGNYIGIFRHCIGPWEDFLGEMYRPYTSVVSNITISIAESKNYIVFGIVSEVSEGSGDPDFWDSYVNNYLRCVIFNKVNGMATSCSIEYRLDYNNLTLHGTAISCYDYDNNKFILSNLQSHQNQRIFDIDVTGNLVEDTFAVYSTSKSNTVYRIIRFGDDYYTLYLFNSDIYIRKGVNLDTIHDQSTYMLLNNVTCDTAGININEKTNQLASKYTSFMYKAGSKYYGFVGEACLPLIDEEGMNAFIKIKN